MNSTDLKPNPTGAYFDEVVRLAEADPNVRSFLIAQKAHAQALGAAMKARTALVLAEKHLVAAQAVFAEMKGKLPTEAKALLL